MSASNTLGRQESSTSRVDPSMEATTSQPDDHSEHSNSTIPTALEQKMTFAEQCASNGSMKQSYVQSVKEAIELIQRDPPPTSSFEEKNATTRKNFDNTAAKSDSSASGAFRRIQKELAALDLDPPPTIFLHPADRTCLNVYESFIPQSSSQIWPWEVSFTESNPRDVFEQEDFATDGILGSLVVTDDSLPWYFAQQEPWPRGSYLGFQDEVQNELNARFSLLQKTQKVVHSGFDIASDLKDYCRNYFKKALMESKHPEDVNCLPFGAWNDVACSNQDVDVSKTYDITNISGNATAHLGDLRIKNYFLFDNRCTSMTNRIAEQICTYARNQPWWSGWGYPGVYSSGVVGVLQKDNLYPTGHDAHPFIDPTKLMGLVLNNITGMIGDTMSKILTNTVSSIVPLVATQIQAVQCWHTKALTTL